MKELPETDTFACEARLELDEVIVGARVENVGALDMLNLCDTAELV